MTEIFEQVIECPSVTYALKSKELLKKMGYAVRINKVTRKNSGCGYSLFIKTNESIDSLLQIMRQNGIKASRPME